MIGNPSINMSQKTPRRVETTRMETEGGAEATEATEGAVGGEDVPPGAVGTRPGSVISATGAVVGRSEGGEDKAGWAAEYLVPEYKLGFAAAMQHAVSFHSFSKLKTFKNL